MPLQVCVSFFAPRSGTGTQTVSGIVDRDGNAFTPTLVLFQSCWTYENGLTSGAIPTNRYFDSRGIDLITKRCARAVADVEAAGFKDVAGGTSLGDYSLLDFNAQPSFGGVILRRAKITSTASGSFTLTYDQNDRTGDIVLFTAFGGTDWSVESSAALVDGTYTTSDKPQGLLACPLTPPAASGATFTGTGGQCVTWGWDTRDSGRGASAIQVDLQGTQNSYQRTDAFGLTMTSPTVLPVVSAWADLGYTIAGNTGNVTPATPLVFCGDTLRAAQGAFLQQDATGVQVIDVGLDTKWIMFVSAGNEASSTLQSPNCQIVTGWAAETRQTGFWSGESTPGGFTSPLAGARFLASATTLRFAVANANSTTFTAIAAVTDMDGDAGTVTINWSVNDSVSRQILWFALGEVIVPPPPPPEPVFRTREVVRRRLRRAPIVWNEKGGLQTRVRINLFAVDMQPGVGTSDTPDPLVMVRCSKDGGFTWGNERRITAGRVGEFFNRINTWQWGQGREWVFEVSCTDPVTWNLIGAYIDAEGGEN